jgi:hypothetical protein
MSIFAPIGRRRVLQTGLAAALARSPLAFADDDSPEALARDAYVWGYPLVSFGRYRDAYLAKGNPLNQFVAQPELTTPAARTGGPNVDTIYGYTWLDLRAGPQILQVPEAHDRYYSIQFLDMYADSFAYVGRRATGTKAGAYAIVGPGWTGKLPDGVKAIQSPTPDVMTFSRTYVRDEDDIAAARDIESHYAFSDLAHYPKPALPPILDRDVPLPPILDLVSAGAGYFDELCQRLAQDPPAGDDRAQLARFAKIGIAPGAKPSADPTLKAIFEAAVPVADKLVKTAQYGVVINGWSSNFRMVAFINDPLLRASANKFGPGAHVPEEALYFSLDKGPDGQVLNGAHSYVLRFPKGELPPVDAFWSLTAYTPVMSLIENPIQRYAIKGGMKDLAFGPDGSLELRIQHAQPAQGTANWLPVPEGPFRLVMRTYQPQAAVLNQTYKLPPVTMAS